MSSDSSKTITRASRQILATLSIQRSGLTADQLNRRIAGLKGRAAERLAALEAAGLVHSLRARQYPTGPMVELWFLR